MSEGKLEQNPAAELIREVVAKNLSGALRLSHGKAKAVIYFNEGAVVFAVSNLRAHRLSEFLLRNRILTEAQMAELPEKATDEELSKFLVKSGRLKPPVLSLIQANQVTEILRAGMLWMQGDWHFDSRVKMAGDTHVTVDVTRVLMECARHLPADYVSSRFPEAQARLDLVSGGDPNLMPAEAFVLSRVTPTITLKDLLAVSGLTEQETLRAVYGLSLAGLLQRSDWASSAINGTTKSASAKQPRDAGADPDQTGPDEKHSLQRLFARLERSTDYYEVLDVAPLATPDDVKNAYHTLARRYHPDRFHQSDADLRGRVDSAFARIARAYEILSDPKSRETYDAQRAPSATASVTTSPAAQRRSQPPSPNKEDSRAENSFRRGLAALKENKPEQALRLFAEAANIEPRQARYRAEYGRALIGKAQTRRMAEIELKAAVALEPNNASYRLILAELYKTLGLRRRAEGEIQRALISDPGNETARQLLASLKK